MLVGCRFPDVARRVITYRRYVFRQVYCIHSTFITKIAIIGRSYGDFFAANLLSRRVNFSLMYHSNFIRCGDHGNYRNIRRALLNGDPGMKEKTADLICRTLMSAMAVFPGKPLGDSRRRRALQQGALRGVTYSF